MKVIDVILAVLIILILAYIVNTYVLKSKYMPWAVVGSYSMEPTLEIGDLVVIFPTEVRCGHEDLSKYVNNVVVYLRGDRYIVHRVISVSPEACSLVTKGDANPYPDEPEVRGDDVVGYVISVVPKVGIIGLMFREAITRPFIGVAIILLALLYVITLYAISIALAVRRYH